jgi:hypothetical protein
MKSAWLAGGVLLGALGCSGSDAGSGPAGTGGLSGGAGASGAGGVQQSGGSAGQAGGGMGGAGGQGCSADEIACSAACTNPKVDPRNCGACGHDCGGGDCQEGLCAAELFNLGDPDLDCSDFCTLPMVRGFDVDDTAAYFTLDSMGGPKLVRVERDGSPTSVIASAASGPLWEALHLRNAEVLFEEREGSATRVLGVAKAGGTPSPMADGALAAVRGNTRLSGYDACGRIASRPIEPAAIAEVFPGPGGCNYGLPITVGFDDAGDFGYITSYTGVVNRVGLRAPNVSTTLTDPVPAFTFGNYYYYNSVSFRVTTDSLLWIQGADCTHQGYYFTCASSELWTLPLAGGAPVRVAELPGQIDSRNLSSAFAADGVSAFTTCGDRLCEVVLGSGEVRARAPAANRVLLRDGVVHALLDDRLSKDPSPVYLVMRR